MSRDFLLELGCEELPPKKLYLLSQCLKDEVAKNLEEAGLAYSEIQTFASPRRLALLIENLAAKQEDKIVERRGPAVKAAFTADGNPTPAATGFATSCGVSVADLETLENSKGSWLLYKQQQTGLTVQQLLPNLITAAIARLPIGRGMRWGSSELNFIRPVHWLVMLYGDEVVDATILGQKSERETYGHRVHCPQPFPVPQAADYEQLLAEKGYVLADFSKRQETIVAQVNKIADKLNAHAVMPQDLLDEVTALVEWPVALLINFDQRFLDIPAEALISAMQVHQKCFAMQDEQGKLLASFITVSNIESKDPQQVVMGNERVMRARLADAAFFYETDLKQRLEQHLPALAHVTFQAKLGNMLEKSERLANLSSYISEVVSADHALATRAGLLSKCDLLTEMVGEFPELQGIMGYYYALHDEESPTLAVALKEQYLPKYAGDVLPNDPVACSLALAERLDTLIGIFGINQIPTGEKDPFGLRRAAVGIIRIIIEKNLSLNLSDLLQQAINGYQVTLENSNTVAQVKKYIFDRMRAWYQDQDMPVDVFAAVLARQTDDLLDFHRRVQAVLAFRQNAAAESLAAANKRVSKLLQKAAAEAKVEAATVTAKRVESAAKGEAINIAVIDNKLLEKSAEKELAEEINNKNTSLIPIISAADYPQALELLADLRQPVDKFFDEVMVMTDDLPLRNNRLALLAQLRQLFLQVADISLLQ